MVRRVCGRTNVLWRRSERASWLSASALITTCGPCCRSTGRRRCPGCGYWRMSISNQTTHPSSCVAWDGHPSDRTAPRPGTAPGRSFLLGGASNEVRWKPAPGSVTSTRTSLSSTWRFSVIRPADEELPWRTPFVTSSVMSRRRLKVASASGLSASASTARRARSGDSIAAGSRMETWPGIKSSTRTPDEASADRPAAWARASSMSVTIVAYCGSPTVSSTWRTRPPGVATITKRAGPLGRSGRRHTRGRR